MRILFDQGTPAPLRAALDGHSVITAFELGWARITDRELLDSAEAEGFDVMVTTDQNLRHQQVLEGRRLAILVLRTTDWRLIREHLAAVVDALRDLEPGRYLELSFPRS